MVALLYLSLETLFQCSICGADVSPLCLPCRVAEVLEGVHEDYMKRSAYISYLVKSHQKFQDAKLQVAAVQVAVNR